MIEISQIHIESGDPLDKLMNHLEGRVFHVTKACYWPEIYASGEINPNINGELKTSFGSSKNSYFKNKGCVSLFDYRNIYEEEPQKHMYKCCPTNPLNADSGIAILIFKPEIHSKLQSWEGWKNGDLSQMVVPHVEAGYFGSIPLSLVKKVIIVTISEDRNSLAAMLRGSVARNKDG
jgi:hypothetical protein